MIEIVPGEKEAVMAVDTAGAEALQTEIETETNIFHAYAHHL